MDPPSENTFKIGLCAKINEKIIRNTELDWILTVHKLIIIGCFFFTKFSFYLMRMATTTGHFLTQDPMGILIKKTLQNSTWVNRWASCLKNLIRM